MAMEEYYVQEKKRDSILILLLFLIGWFGLEKFYYAKSFKKAWKFVLVKFLYSLILIGLIWNIFDIVQAFRKKYQLDFREYFR